MACRIKDLPTEVIEQIGSHLDRAVDFRRFRLACKWAESRTLRVFSKKFFSTFHLSHISMELTRPFEALMGISKHPVFSKQIETIIHLEVMSPAAIITPWIKWEDKRQESTILIPTLQRLPNLRQVQIAGTTERPTGRFGMPDMPLGEPRDSLCLFFQWINLASMAGITIPTIFIYPITFTPTRNAPRPLISQQIFPCVANLADSALSALTSLNIPAPLAVYDGDHFHSEGLCFLLWANKLESLDLDFLQSGITTIARDTLRFISPRAPVIGQSEPQRPAAYLPSLRSLVLGNMSVTPKDLANTIERLGNRPLSLVLNNTALQIDEDEYEGTKVNQLTYDYGRIWEPVLRSLGQTSFKQVVLLGLVVEVSYGENMYRRVPVSFRVGGGNQLIVHYRDGLGEDISAWTERMISCRINAEGDQLIDGLVIDLLGR